MNIDELVINLRKILEFTFFDVKVDFRTSNDIKIWRSKVFRDFENNSSVQFYSENNATSFFYKFVDNVRDYCNSNDLCFSEQYLDNLMMQFIGKFHDPALKKDLVGAVRKFLDKFDKTNYETYFIFLPVSHYDFRHEVNLEKFNIKKLTYDDFCKYFNKDEDMTKLNFESLTKDNETETIAIIEVESIEQNDAIQKAKDCLKKFIHSEKLFDPDSFITSRTGHYHLTCESITISNTSSKSWDSISNNYYIPLRITPNDDFYKNLEPYRNKLYQFLFEPHLTSFQQSILSSLYWLGEIDALRDTNVKKYLSYLIGLEKITMKKNEQQKKKKFARHLCKFYNTPKAIKFYETCYERRNDLLHDENLKIFDEQVFTLLSILRQILLVMIDHYDKFETIDEFWLQQYSVEL